jgi:hypothetical protein
MAKIRTLRSQNKDLPVAQPSNSFLERFAKNRGKLPIIRARTRESRKRIHLVYDYFCIPHEHAGMVGRIVVGEATGPGAEPFDYFKGMPQGANWLTVPMPAQKR